MHSEREVRAENVVAEKSHFFGLTNRYAETIDCDRIFRADVEITVLCADRVTCNHHTFDDGKRIAFENGTIHKRARVAFVTVADDVFVAVGLSVCKLPFSARRETAAATSAKS